MSFILCITVFLFPKNGIAKVATFPVAVDAQSLATAATGTAYPLSRIGALFYNPASMSMFDFIGIDVSILGMFHDRNFGDARENTLALFPISFAISSQPTPWLNLGFLFTSSVYDKVQTPLFIMGQELHMKFQWQQYDLTPAISVNFNRFHLGLSLSLLFSRYHGLTPLAQGEKYEPTTITGFMANLGMLFDFSPIHFGLSIKFPLADRMFYPLGKIPVGLLLSENLKGYGLFAKRLIENYVLLGYFSYNAEDITAVEFRVTNPPQISIGLSFEMIKDALILSINYRLFFVADKVINRFILSPFPQEGFVHNIGIGFSTNLPPEIFPINFHLGYYRVSRFKDNFEAMHHFAGGFTFHVSKKLSFSFAAMFIPVSYNTNLQPLPGIQVNLRRTDKPLDALTEVEKATINVIARKIKEYRYMDTGEAGEKETILKYSQLNLSFSIHYSF